MPISRISSLTWKRDNQIMNIQFWTICTVVHLCAVLHVSCRMSEKQHRNFHLLSQSALMFIGIENSDIFQVKLTLQVKPCEKQRVSLRSCEVRKSVHSVVYQMLILNSHKQNSKLAFEITTNESHLQYQG